VIARRLIASMLVVGASLVALWAAATRSRSEEQVVREPIERESIVMLGDSITAGGDWTRLLPERPVVNRGYSGYTTAQLRPIAAQVAAARPHTVFVLAGTNDVRDDIGPDETVRQLTGILGEFEQSSPDTRVVIQTVLPRAATAEAIVATNRAIVAVAAERGVEVLDLHVEFDDGAGGLRPHETTDGWHLSGAGYRRWAALLEASIPPPG
jgi:lysophospholipase L1-like esterase